MVATVGLIGLRPTPDMVNAIVTPPYDVIKPGSALEKLLKGNSRSFYHVILGSEPGDALGHLVEQKCLLRDEEPCFYLYEQSWNGQSRLGVLVAAEVSPYEKKQIIRHEKTFDDKVKGRIVLARAIGYTSEPCFTLTKAPLQDILVEATKRSDPLYRFSSDFAGLNDLHGIANRIWRIPTQSEDGQAIQRIVAIQPLYIADGHHRYHAALKNKQTHFLTYITERATIQAYNRVINGKRSFAEISSSLTLKPCATFATPKKKEFCIYTRNGCFSMTTKSEAQDIVSRLDCSILEKELYPKLGLTHDLIANSKYFDYYPESQLKEMTAAVDRNDYDIAVALHPVSIEELMAVADAGLSDPAIVMPEKSTFFAPKILSGLILYRHQQHS